MIKTKKAGLVTKLVVLALIVYAIVALWNLNTRIGQANSEVVSLNQQLQSQTQENAELEAAIANSGNDEYRKDIARQKLGLLEPGEKMFYITD